MIDGTILCTYCLMARDIRVSFRAFDGKQYTEGPAVGARDIIRWYETLDPVSLKFIDYAGNRAVLVPVAVWQGTPICEPHLWDAHQEHYGRRR